jgi:hypothetical protein
MGAAGECQCHSLPLTVPLCHFSFCATVRRPVTVSVVSVGSSVRACVPHCVRRAHVHTSATPLHTVHTVPKMGIALCCHTAAVQRAVSSERPKRVDHAHAPIEGH